MTAQREKKRIWILQRICSGLIFPAHRVPPGERGRETKVSPADDAAVLQVRGTGGYLDRVLWP